MVETLIRRLSTALGHRTVRTVDSGRVAALVVRQEPLRAIARLLGGSGSDGPWICGSGSPTRPEKSTDANPRSARHGFGPRRGVGACEEAAPTLRWSCALDVGAIPGRQDPAEGHGELHLSQIASPRRSRCTSRSARDCTLPVSGASGDHPPEERRRYRVHRKVGGRTGRTVPPLPAHPSVVAPKPSLPGAVVSRPGRRRLPFSPLRSRTNASAARAAERWSRA
jgi:hypothetical protein